MIQAFTVIELLVVMVLTTVLVGLAFMAFQIIQQQFFHFEKQNATSLQIDNFNRLWRYDTESCRDLTINGSFITCQHDDHLVSYEFYDNQIVRNGTVLDYRPDTFFIANRDLVAAFQKYPIDKGTIDFISFELKINDIWTERIFSKTYGAKNLTRQSRYYGRE